MGHNIFGWSYPPGCSGPPDYDPYIPEWHEDLYCLLEDNNIGQDTIDKILKLIEEEEIQREIEREKSVEEHENRKDIFAELEAERARQVELWGNDFDNKNTANDWCAYICNYVANGAYDGRQEKYDPKKFRENLKKAACLCVAAIEAIDRNGDCSPRHYENKPNAGAVDNN